MKGFGIESSGNPGRDEGTSEFHQGSWVVVSGFYIWPTLWYKYKYPTYSPTCNYPHEPSSEELRPEGGLQDKRCWRWVPLFVRAHSGDCL